MYLHHKCRQAGFENIFFLLQIIRLSFFFSYNLVELPYLAAQFKPGVKGCMSFKLKVLGINMKIENTKITANEIKGVIFDLDGTMVDNMSLHHLIWQKVLGDLGLKLTIGEVKKKVFGVNEEIIERLFGERFSLAERQKISAEKEAEYRRTFLPKLNLIGGLSEFLEQLAENNIPMGVGSAAPPENVDFVLDHLKIRHYFKSIRHAKNIEKGKPHPEIFLKVSADLGLLPQQCLVFEDSPTGIETARRAGCPGIAITTTHQAEEFDVFPNIIRCMPDFTQFTVIDLRTIKLT